MGLRGKRIFSINSVWSTVVSSGFFDLFWLGSGFFSNFSLILFLQLFIVVGPMALHKFAEFTEVWECLRV